jgi:hypothetical protein
MSVAQGLGLAAIFYMIDKLFFAPVVPSVSVSAIKETIYIGRSVVSFLVKCALWHRYITHDQYYAWRLSSVGAITPFAFAVVDVVLVLTTPLPAYAFAFAMAAVSFAGFLAHCNTARRHEHLNAQTLFEVYGSEIESKAREDGQSINGFGNSIYDGLEFLAEGVGRKCLHLPSFSRLSE